MLKIRDFYSNPNKTITPEALQLLAGSRPGTVAVLQSDAPVEGDTDYAPLAQKGPPPASYDAHIAFPACAPVIRDQGSCGSCWTFSTTGVASQRMCLLNENVDGTLVGAPQGTLSCDKTCSSNNCNAGCDGGYPDLAFQNMLKVRYEL